MIKALVLLLQKKITCISEYVQIFEEDSCVGGWSVTYNYCKSVSYRFKKFSGSIIIALQAQYSTSDHGKWGRWTEALREKGLEQIMSQQFHLHLL